MKSRWLVMAVAGLACTAVAAGLAGSASARVKQNARPGCVAQPAQITLESIIFGTRPVPNGCAPPVFSNGQYVGQDPDPNIRAYLQRDWQSGYDGPQQ